MLKKSVRDSSRFAVRKVLSLWNMAHIPTTIERNAVDKLEQLFDKWIKLKKSSRLVSIAQTANRVRPKLGFGYGSETAKFLGFGYGRNSHLGFGLVSVTAVTRNLVSA